MNTTVFNPDKTIGWLLIIGAIALMIPYTILTMTFEYPDILRQGVGTVLTRFHQGGSALIATWFAFAITGIPLIPAYIFIGQKLEDKAPLMRTATAIGVIGLVIQMIGLLRWSFVVPVLADAFVNTTDPNTKNAVIIAFKTIHQFAGVVLGEHLGQLFTVIWTVMVSVIFSRLKMFPSWVHYLGYSSAFIYFLAQAELFQTVIPSFPVWELAGILGSTLWLLWLVIVGILFVKNKNS